MTGIKRYREKSQPFPEDTYLNSRLSDLVLYAVFSLETKGIEATFPKLVVESYRLFPKKFHLQGYPEYPDANRVRTEMQRMEGKLPSSDPKLVMGSMKTSYKITDAGFKKLKEIQVKLASGDKDRREIDKKFSDRRQKMGKVLLELEKHPLYQRYLQKGQVIDVPESLLRDLLFATMETSHESLREKIKTLKEYCDALDKKDLNDFLEFCSMKHKGIFHSPDD